MVKDTYIRGINVTQFTHFRYDMLVLIILLNEITLFQLSPVVNLNRFKRYLSGDPLRLKCRCRINDLLPFHFYTRGQFSAGFCSRESLHRTFFSVFFLTGILLPAHRRNDAGAIQSEVG